MVAGANSLNLGMAQIIVTAATPMVEDGADKSFPPVGESDNTESQQSKEQQADVEKKAKPKPDIVPKPTAAKIAAHKQPPKEGNVAITDEVKDQLVSAVTITLTEYPVSCSAEDEHQSFDSADGTAVVQQPEDPFIEKPAAGAAPAVAAAAAAEGASAGFEADFEANFDANFDDAFAGSAGGGGGGGGGGQSTGLDMNTEAQVEDVIEAPKQVVGGRASIPEELDSNQLARLENLKESNA